MQALRDVSEARDAWRQRIRYLLGDEYQDTNGAQYELMRLLIGDRGAFTVVGDDDQSIYAWRGARPDNLQALARDYPGLSVVKLERKLDGGTFELLAELGKDVTSYEDFSVVPKAIYVYRVRAVNDLGNSPWSNEATATTGLVRPTGRATVHAPTFGPSPPGLVCASGPGSPPTRG